MPFGFVWAQEIVLDGVQIPHGRWQFWGEKGRPVVEYRDAVVSCAKTAHKMPVGLSTLVGPRNHVLGGGSDPYGMGGESGRPVVKYSDCLPSTMQKMRCRLGFELRWAKSLSITWGTRSPHGKGHVWGACCRPELRVAGHISSPVSR